MNQKQSKNKKNKKKEAVNPRPQKGAVRTVNVNVSSNKSNRRNWAGDGRHGCGRIDTLGLGIGAFEPEIAEIGAGGAGVGGRGGAQPLAWGICTAGLQIYPLAKDIYSGLKLRPARGLQSKRARSVCCVWGLCCGGVCTVGFCFRQAAHITRRPAGHLGCGGPPTRGRLCTG